MRIVIAEDQFLLRQGLENLFTRHGFEVVAAVDDGPSLTDAVLTHRPDVALLGRMLQTASEGFAVLEYEDENVREIDGI